MSETDISAQIQDALDALAIPNERVQCGQAVGRHGGHMQLARRGTPDIWTAYGWLETKVPNGKLSAEQWRWHARATANGVNVACVTGSIQAVRIVLAWRAERRSA